jgi:CxxC motif-containing protein
MTADPGSARAPGAEQKDLVCIACPLGCRMVVTVGAAADEVTVSGNRCARGEAYGKEEVLAPRRVLTAVVPTDSAQFPCAPVRTDGAVSRRLVGTLLSDLYRLRVALPVRAGQVLIQDFDGARVIFTRTLPPDEVPAVGEAGTEPEREDEVPSLQKTP